MRPMKYQTSPYDELQTTFAAAFPTLGFADQRSRP